MKKILTVTIGIPAYKSEQNIAFLLKTLLSQKERGVHISNIFVNLDDPKGKTSEIVHKIAKSNKKVKPIDQPKRRGMAYGVKQMLRKNKSDVFILLNDDILIKDKLFTHKLILPFKDGNVGLVGGNPQPLNPKNFIQKAEVSTFRAFERTRLSYKKGNNGMTCDGKVMAISKKLATKIKFPENLSLTGNVDSFFYLSSIQEGFKYRHAEKAVVFFEYPDSLSEYYTWTKRNNSNRYVMDKCFGSWIYDEYKIPFMLHLQSKLIETFKNPFGAIFIFLVGIYAKIQAKSYADRFNATWEVVSSTKKRLG